MQYALFDAGERKILLDANEFYLLKNWQKNQLRELSDFCESEHSFYLCYGGYLLNPDISDQNVNADLKSMENFWLTAIDEYGRYFYQVALYSIRTFPLITVGHQRIVPFAALIKSDSNIISKIASKSFAVTAFLRIADWDIITNILNREGLFAFNGVEFRHKETLGEENWRTFIDKNRMFRCCRRIIRCNK
ncbi:TPA: DNA topoisomerase III [Salmonella enterica subsp. enterica serovar Paratyphi B]|nr:DNA topoisomerase III [Salmonella enterica]EKZ3297868.1 DNA topoisomerase III [Salmonella enterica]